MGQKVNPHALRVGIIKDWDSKWYNEEYYPETMEGHIFFKCVDWNSKLSQKLRLFNRVVLRTIKRMKLWIRFKRQRLAI